MHKLQRYRHDTLVRIRDFGAANGALFPESSTGGQLFARVAAAVAEVDGHLSSRVVARAEARKLKASTRAAVLDLMRTVAATGRRASRREFIGDVFRLPRSRSDKALVATARVFIEEARRREAEFVRLGLPPTFMAEFASVMNDLDQAVNTRLNSAHLRRKAQVGIATALRRGLDDVAELDVVVPNVLREDPVRLAQWRRARHIDGQGTSAPAAVKSSLASAAPPSAAAATEPHKAATTNDVVVVAGEEVTPAPAEGVGFPKAS
jgi:hypothetical protein